MDLNKIAEELFSKVRGRFPGVTIGDGNGNVTNEPSEARFFEFPFTESNADQNNISITLDEENGVTIMYTDDISEDSLGKKNWYNFLRELREFSKKRMLNFDVRNITKSNLEKRDYRYLAKNSGESSMNESKLYGTSKYSYQDMDGARMVIKHTESVNDEAPTARTRNIGSIFIESPSGERFKYPFKHLAGARAMARHVAEGGTTYDEFGEHIVGLSEELSKLRKFKNYMGRSSVMAESLADYMGVVNERIGTVKKRIEKLQKESYYKEAYETFEKPVFEEIPEDVKENWIDQLTIRQFNEELKDVFPYIYKLIGEHTRTKELGPDSFTTEDDDPCWDDYKQVGMKKKNGKEVPNCVPEEAQLEAIFNELMGQWAEEDEKVSEAGISDLSGDLESDLENYLERYKYLKMLATKHQGKDDRDVLNHIQDKMRELAPKIKRLQSKKAAESEESEEAQAPLSEFILSFYDRTNGSFPKGETAVLTMVEKDYGEQYIDPAKQFIERINHTFEQHQAGRGQRISEEGGDGLHGFFSEEKGPNDHLGIALRVFMPHPRAMGGFTTDMINFWGSMDQVKSGDDGMNGVTLKDAKAKGIMIHSSRDEAMQAAQSEHGEEGGKGQDSHDEYRRLRQLAGI